MAFVTEDGTGLANSNAYISVAEFKTYWTDRGVDYTALSDTLIQGYIVQGSDYVDGRYTFKGYEAVSTQAMAWPRTNTSGGEIVDTKTRKVITTSEVPTSLKNAMCELAAIVGDKGNRKLDDTTSQNIKSKKVGPLSTTYGNSNNSAYGGANSGAFSEYRIVTNYIKGLLITSGIIRR